MRLLILSFACLFFQVSLSYGAFEFTGHSVRGAGMAGAFTALSDDAGGLRYNPAGLRFAESVQLDSSYSNLYGMKDLNYISLNMAMPTLTAGTWAAGYSSLGNAAYKETDIRLGLAAGLGGGMYAGAVLKSERVQIGNEGGSAGAIGFDVGIISNVSEYISFGICSVNINSPTLGDTSEPLGRKFMAGAAIRPSKNIVSTIDLHKSLEKDIEIRTGAEFKLNDSLKLRSGIQTRPVRFSLGFGLGWSIFELEYAFLSHKTLASQHIFGLKMNFKGEERRRHIYEMTGEEEKLKTEKAFKKVDLNSATLRELQEVPGMGKIRAKKVIEYRQKSGAFKSVKELLNIYGFSKSSYDRVRGFVVVGDRSKAREYEEIKIVPEEKETLRKPKPKNNIEKPEVPVKIKKPEPVKIEKPAEKIEEPVKMPAKPKAEEVKKAESKQKLTDFNSAKVSDLTKINGITPALSRTIIRYKRTRGSFKSWDDLRKVPGINNNHIEALREKFSIQ